MLTSFTEAFAVQRGAWNHQVLLAFREVEGNGALIEEMVRTKWLTLNSGLMLGPPETVASHARALAMAVLGLRKPPEDRTGLDQAAHNLLAFRAQSSSGATRFNVVPLDLPNLTCPVLTMHMLGLPLVTCDPVRVDAPVFRLRSAATGRAFTMVHRARADSNRQNWRTAHRCACDAEWNRAHHRVIRAVVCHHRHLLHVAGLECGARATCSARRGGAAILRQDEREVLHRLLNPASWRDVCAKAADGTPQCETNESVLVGLRNRPMEPG